MAGLSDTQQAALESWMRSRPGLDPEGTVSDLSLVTSGGNSAETLFFTYRGGSDGAPDRRSFVLRRPVTTFSFFLDDDVHLPARMMREMARHDVPVPPVIGDERDESVLGGPFLVTERVPGRAPAQWPIYTTGGWVMELSPEERRRMWANALETLARIHRIDWRDGFAFLDRPERGPTGYAQYMAGVQAWRDWALGQRRHPFIDSALERLREAAPMEIPVSVLWGDPQPPNMLFGDDLAVVAVLDWEVAALGPAEADLGWWLFMTSLHDRTAGGRPSGVPDREAAIAIYQAALNRPVLDVERFELLAMVRMALVLARAADRQISFGRIPPQSRSGDYNPVTAMIAQKLGLPFEDDLSDYALLTRAFSDREGGGGAGA